MERLSPFLCSFLCIILPCDFVGTSARILSKMVDAYWLAHKPQILEKEKKFSRLVKSTFFKGKFTTVLASFLTCRTPLSLFSLSLCLFPYLSSFHLPSFFLSFFFSFFFLFPFKDCNSLFDFSDMGFLEFGALNLGDHCMTWLCKYIGQTTQSSRGILNFLTTSNFPTFHPLGSNK